MERLAGKLTGNPRNGPYLFVLMVSVSDVYGLSLVGALETGRIRFVADPGTNLIVPGALLLTVSILRLHRKYEEAVSEMPSPDPDVERRVDARANVWDRLLRRFGILPTFRPQSGPRDLVPRRLRWGVYGTSLIIYGAWLASNPAGPAALEALTGPAVAAVKVLLLQPFFYYLLVAEFGALLLCVHVLFPFAVRRDALINFADPHGLGGLAPIARLLKISTFQYYLLLTVYGLFIGTAIVSLLEPFPLFVLIAGSTVGALLFLAPSYWLQTHVSRSKELKIEVLAEDLSAAGPAFDDGIPPDIAFDGDSVGEYVHEYLRIEKVRSTQVNPIDGSAIGELIVAFVTPIATHLASTFVLQSLPV